MFTVSGWCPDAAASMNDAIRACRFCLRVLPELRPLPHDGLTSSDIPQLFESVTQIKLDLSGGYSEWWCLECEHRMRSAAQTRLDFVRVVQQWQHLLRSDNPNSEIASPSTSALMKIELLQPDFDGLDILASNVKEENENDEQDDDDDNRRDNESVLSERNCDDDASSDDQPLAKRVTRMKKNTPTTAETSTKPKRPYKTNYWRPPKGSPYICDICGSRLSNKKCLLNHILCKHHPNDDSNAVNSSSSTAASRRTCHICGKTGLKSMARHLRDHESADQYKCAHCPRTFCRRERLQHHERTHTGERPYICDVCGFTFTAPTGLIRHRQMLHGAGAMPAPNDGDDDDGSQVVDVEGGGGGAGGISKTGGKVRKQRTQRRQIVRVRVAADTVVNTEGGDTGGVILHRMTAAVPMPPKLPPRGGHRLECPLCQKTYVERTSLYPHMRIQHGAAGLAAWKQFLATRCLVCNEKFDTADELTAHKPVHLTHQCDICKQRFQSAVSLRRHAQMHPAGKERPFRCEICDARYAEAFTLRTHQLRVHTDVRPYQCTVCGQGYVHMSELNSHVKKQHTFWKQLRPHRCEDCAESFRTGYLLNVHREKHTGEYRYKCKVCGRNLYKGAMLVQHMKFYHPVEWQAEEAEEQRGRAEAIEEGGGTASTSEFMQS